MTQQLTLNQPWRETLTADLLAGATGAVAGAPQAMAFAIIAGVSPVYGLYTAIVSTIIAGLTTGSTFLTVGPTNALSLIVGATLIRFDDDNQLERLFVLTLLVGIFQTAFGLLRLGNVTRFVSNAVMTGFISGAGVLIILGQVGELTGYNGQGDRIILRMLDWLANLGRIDLRTTLIGIVAIIIIHGLHHTRFKSVATLTAIISTGIFIALFNWSGIHVVEDIAPIPQSLPSPVMPSLEFVPQLWSVGLAMAILALVQGAGISQNVPEPDGSTPNISRDFLGQGLGNLAGGFLQNMPSGGSLSRTAVNFSAGARTRWANIFAGIFVALILLAFGSLIEQIALAALAGHLMVAAASLIRPSRISEVWNVGRSARIAMVSTFLATLFLPLEYSIYIGVILSLVMYLYTSANNISVRQLVKTESGRFKEVPIPDKLPSKTPTLLTVYGNLYFAAVSTLEEQLPDPSDADFAVVILRLRGNAYLGSTGIRLLDRYATKLEERGGKLMLCGVSVQVSGQLERTDAIQRLGQENVFIADDELMSSTERALTAAQAWIDEQTHHLDTMEV